VWEYASRTLTGGVPTAEQNASAVRTELATELGRIDVATSTRASQASVSAIPTNPLLTTDARLNNLDATISSRSTLTAGELAGVAVDVQTMNGAEVIGDGTVGNPWRGVGVAP
jgi:hypothetical protein